MKLNRFVGTVITFFFVLIQIKGSDTLVFQPGKWLSLPNSIERFTTFPGDTLQLPHGYYEWKLLADERTGGHYELGYIKANFEQGKPHGELVFMFVELDFEIKEFDLNGVNASATGIQTRVNANFQKGKPTGKWVIETGPWQDTSFHQKIFWEPDRKFIRLKSTTKLFEGHLDDEGFFHGIWQWTKMDGDSISFEYDHGILRNCQVNGQNILAELFNHTNKNIPRIDAEGYRVPTYSWSWLPGVSVEDSLYKIQKPLLEYRDMLKQPLYKAGNILDAHPLLEWPSIKGTAIYIHLISDKVEDQLKESRGNLIDWKGKLIEEIELPIFQLRRSGDQKVDSLLQAVETFTGNLQSIQTQIDLFLQESSRIITPYFLGENKGEKFDTHDAYGLHLIGLSNKQKNQFETLVQAIDFRKNLLRFQGNLEELEQDWFNLFKAIEDKYTESEEHPLLEKIFYEFVQKDFIDRKEMYAIIESMSGQRDFLLHSIECFQFILDFFKEKRIKHFTEAEAYFIEKYTTFLYNPYMDVNNIEVIRKKKFIQYIIQYFWPYLESRMMNARDVYQLQELCEKVDLYKEGLSTFAADNSNAAKRLERRVRGEKNMERIDALLYEYFKGD
jgi:hypothetical protein